MAQLNLLERAKEIAFKLNGNKREVIEVWFRGAKVWPKSELEYELKVDKSTVTLNQSNNWLDKIHVFAPEDTSWEFGND